MTLSWLNPFRLLPDVTDYVASLDTVDYTTSDHEVANTPKVEYVPDACAVLPVSERTPRYY